MCPSSVKVLCSKFTTVRKDFRVLWKIGWSWESQGPLGISVSSQKSKIYVIDPMTLKSFDIASFQSYLNPEEASGCCHSSKFVFWPLFWKHWFSLLNLLHKLWRSSGTPKHASKSKKFFEDYPDHHRYGETGGRLEIPTFWIFPYSVNYPTLYVLGRFLWLDTEVVP